MYRNLAWVGGIGSAILLCYGIYTCGKSPTYGLPMIALALIGGFLNVISSLAASEGINLFVNIANDVRKIADGKVHD